MTLCHSYFVAYIWMSHDTVSLICCLVHMIDSPHSVISSSDMSHDIVSRSYVRIDTVPWIIHMVIEFRVMTRDLRCVAVCCSVLQCVAVRCSVLQCCNVSQCVAACCSVLQCVAVCYSVLQCVAVRCSVSQCVAVCCDELHRQNFESRHEITPCHLELWHESWHRVNMKDSCHEPPPLKLMLMISRGTDIWMSCVTYISEACEGMSQIWHWVMSRIATHEVATYE